MVEVAAPREEGVTGRSLLPTLLIAVSLGGVACALTLVFLSMRAVMNVGGFCAEGGAYQIRQHCPQGTPAIMTGAIIGGILLALAYAAFAASLPSLVNLLWPALFLSLGWNFFKYAFDPPGRTSGVVWGWLVCGIIFAVMGSIPLVATLPGTIREFVKGEDQSHGFPAGSPFPHAKRMAARVGVPGSGVVSELERLDALRKSGALKDEEYERVKRRLIGT